MAGRKNRDIFLKTFLALVVLFIILAGGAYIMLEENINLSKKILKEIDIDAKKISIRHFSSLKLQGVTLTDREKVIGAGIGEVLINFEKFDIFSKKKEISAECRFENVISVLDTHKKYINDGSATGSFIDKLIKFVTDEKIISAIIDPQQRYSIAFDLYFSENEYFKINKFKAVSDDVRIGGEYEYYNGRDLVHAEVSISFSPEITANNPDLISQYRLEKGENGWYGFVYEVTSPAAFVRGLSGLFLRDEHK